MAGENAQIANEKVKETASDLYDEAAVKAEIAQ
jgi:hypothetical protein